MRITILFGGSNKERLLSVASAQALHAALPEGGPWLGGADDAVHGEGGRARAAHPKPFEEPFKADGNSLGDLAAALDRAKTDARLLVLALHGGRAENGELQGMCEVRGLPFTGSGSTSSHLAFDKIAAKRFAVLGGVSATQGIALEEAEQALATYGKLIAKPVMDGSSYGLMFVNASQDLVAVRKAAETEAYLIEPFISGVEGPWAVLEQADGSLIALPPIEIVPAAGAFDYFAKYLANATKEICPGRFSPEVTAALQSE